MLLKNGSLIKGDSASLQLFMPTLERCLKITGPQDQEICERLYGIPLPANINRTFPQAQSNVLHEDHHWEIILSTND